MARERDRDLNDERRSELESERERLRGVAADEEEFDDADESDEEDLDQEDESTF